MKVFLVLVSLAVLTSAQYLDQIAMESELANDASYNTYVQPQGVLVQQQGSLEQLLSQPYYSGLDKLSINAAAGVAQSLNESPNTHYQGLSLLNIEQQQPIVQTYAQVPVQTYSQPAVKVHAPASVKTISQTYSQPPIKTYSQPPVQTYSQPAINVHTPASVKTISHTYSQPPIKTYSQPPVQTYSQPAVNVPAPASVKTISQTYSQPAVQTYSQTSGVETYSQPPVQTYSESVVNTYSQPTQIFTPSPSIPENYAPPPVQVFENSNSYPRQVVTVQENYGPPAQVVKVQESYGPPVQVVEETYGPPSQAVYQSDTYAPPQNAQVVTNSYGPPGYTPPAVLENYSPTAKLSDSYGQTAEILKLVEGALEVDDSYGAPQQSLKNADSYSSPQSFTGVSNSYAPAQKSFESNSYSYGPPQEISQVYGAPEGGREHKHIFVHAAPNEPHYPRTRILKPSKQEPDKHYQIIFVKAPSPIQSDRTEIELPPEPEQKTLVYVLTKTPEKSHDVKIIAPASRKPSAPEVYFIRYAENAPTSALSPGYGAPTAYTPAPVRSKNFDVYAPSMTHNSYSSNYQKRETPKAEDLKDNPKT